MLISALLAGPFYP